MIFKGACVIMIKKMVVTIDGNGVIETHRKNALVIENITVDLTKKQNIIIYRPCWYKQSQLETGHSGGHFGGNAAS